jgi:Domain of unknown function (DUF4184)
MPDFQYFVHLTSQERDAHTYPGVLLLTLPAALLALFVFHAILKWPAISLVPRALQERLVEPARRFRWRPTSRAAAILGSLALGILTHIAWDSFTHADGLVVQAWPSFRTPLFYVGRTAIPAFKVAQHLSTLAGGLFIIGALAGWYKRTPTTTFALPRLLSRIGNPTLLSVGVCFTLCIACGRAWRAAGSLADLPALQRFASTLAVTSVSTAALLLVVYSSVWWYSVRKSGWNTRLAEGVKPVSSR